VETNKNSFRHNAALTRISSETAANSVIAHKVVASAPAHRGKPGEEAYRQAEISLGQSTLF
jgi:hypothetical protein